jgi:hypothetical protein
LDASEHPHSWHFSLSNLEIIRKTAKSTIAAPSYLAYAMKTKNSVTIAALSIATALLLFSPAAFAAAPQPLSMNIQGVITGAGSQQYAIAGSHLIAGSFAGQPLTGPVNYRVDATVNGLTTTGSASISLGTGSQRMSISIQILDEVPAAVFPLDLSDPYNPVNCVGSSCTSEIPLFFTGMASITTQGSSHPTVLPVAIESAYWNPFGGPIVIASLDDPINPTLSLVVTYNMATINWTGVEVQGSVVGTYGSNPILGGYATLTNSHENLVAGTEQDGGQIFLAGMSDASLNSMGTISGTTKFSLAGSEPCPLSFMLPAGTCILTGASSTGQFQMTDAAGGKIVGSFGTSWSVPSLFTTTTASASVTQR